MAESATGAQGPVRLTSLAHGGGCGCKIAPGVLQQILAGVIGFTASKAAPEQWSVATGDPLMVYGIRGTDPAQIMPYYTELVDTFKAKQSDRLASGG